MSFNTDLFDGEQLTIHHPLGDIEMVGPAWVLTDLANLSDPAVSEAENRIAPGVAGSVPLPQIEDEVRTSCPLWVGGDVDSDGDPWPTAQIGLRRNWAFLASRLFVPSGVSPAFDATYTPVDPDEPEIECRVQFGAPVVERRTTVQWFYKVPIVLPDGALLGGGS